MLRGMTKVNSKNIYEKKFNEMLLIEEKARDLYKYYVDRIKDPELLGKFNEIYNDEVRHVQIVKSFIDKLSK